MEEGGGGSAKPRGRGKGDDHSCKVLAGCLTYLAEGCKAPFKKFTFETNGMSYCTECFLEVTQSSAKFSFQYGLDNFIYRYHAETI